MVISLRAFNFFGTVAAMDARWFVFKPKIQIWVNLGGPCNGR
jgi:hypothetical protein